MQTLPLEEITKERLLEALQQVPLRLRRSDGQVFIVTREQEVQSPFDVPSVPVSLTAQEIVEAIHEGRHRDRQE